MRDWRECPYRSSTEPWSHCDYTSSLLGWSVTPYQSCCQKCARAGDVDADNVYLKAHIANLLAARVRRGDAPQWLAAYNDVPGRDAFKKYVALRGKRIAAWFLDDVNDKAHLSSEECAALANREGITDDDFDHKEVPRAPRIPRG